MFPICDEQGRVIGFSGRVLAGDEKTAKYVNSPETPIFTKSKVFFGLDKSKRAILDAGCAIVCEGQLDAIACFMAGVQNIVAPQGTAFDSDDAGQNAAVRSLDSLLASGLAVRVAVVPAPHDPDSFIKANGGEAFTKLIAEADGFFDYHLGRLCRTNDIASDKGRLTVVREMAEAVHKTGNTVLVDKYAQKTALRLGVTPEAVRVEFGKTRLVPVVVEAESFADAPERPLEMPRPSTTELRLLKLTLMHDAALDWLAAYLDRNWIQNQAVKDILARRLEAHTTGAWRNLGWFLDGFESAQIRSLITELTMDKRELPNPEQQLADIALRLRNQFLDGQIAGLTQRISQPETSDVEKVDLLREQQQLKLLKRQPLAPLA